MTQPDYPQPPAPVARRRRYRVGWWSLPVAAVAVIVVAAIVVLNRGSSNKHDAAPTTSTAVNAACRDDVVLADRLAAEVTAAIQTHDREKFLDLATTAPVRSALSSWWDNASAIGFTTGGAAVQDEEPSNAASSRYRSGCTTRWTPCPTADPTRRLPATSCTCAPAHCPEAAAT